jgi:hypothetical protein
VIDETVGATIALDLTNGSLANEADFELFTKCPCEAVGPEATHPVVTIFAKLHKPITGIVLYPNIARNGALNGMAKVILIIAVSVGPAVHCSQSFKVATENTIV